MHTDRAANGSGLPEHNPRSDPNLSQPEMQMKLDLTQTNMEMIQIEFCLKHRPESVQIGLRADQPQAI